MWLQDTYLDARARGNQSITVLSSSPSPLRRATPNFIIKPHSTLPQALRHSSDISRLLKPPLQESNHD